MSISWFDRWVKGIDNGVERDQPVQIFVMGSDTWRTEADWPLPGADGRRPVAMAACSWTIRSKRATWRMLSRTASGMGSDSAERASTCQPAVNLTAPAGHRAGRRTGQRLVGLRSRTGCDNAVQLLLGGSRTAPARQQTLQATFDWSYALLSDQERLLLARLSVFSGGWTLLAAERVCGDGIGEDATAKSPLDRARILDIAELIDKSWCWPSLASTANAGTASWSQRGSSPANVWCNRCRGRVPRASSPLVRQSG